MPSLLFWAFALQAEGQGPGLSQLVASLIGLVILVAAVAAMWKVFQKAGEPGWAVLVPIYNMIVLLKIAGKPWWWLLLTLVPLVNIIVGILVAIALAENFGKSAGFGVGLVLLPFIFYPILAWGDASYSRAGG